MLEEGKVRSTTAGTSQEALWIAESLPELSWIMMVSAIETVSNFAASKKSSPEDIVNEWEPDLMTLLNQNVKENERHQLCKKLAKKVGSIRKFHPISYGLLTKSAFAKTC